MKKYQQEKSAIGKPENEGVHDFIMNPPTPNEIRDKYTPKLAEQLGESKNYLEPRGKGEELSGEIYQDFANFFMPGTGGFNMMTRLGGVIIPNLVKQGLLYTGVEPSKAEKAKMGLTLITTLAGQANPGQWARGQIAEAKSMIPPQTVDAIPLGNILVPLYRDLQRGFRNVSTKTKTFEGIEELARKVTSPGRNINSQRIDLHELLQARDDINVWIEEAGGFDVPQNVREATVRNLNRLKSSIIETIDTNLQRINPQVAEMYRGGYEAAAVTHQSNAISNFVEKHFGRKVASAGAKVLFPALAGGSAFLPKTAMAGAFLYPIYKTGQVLYRVANSPVLTRYYNDIITHSVIGNSAAMINSMEKFDKEMEKEEKKQKFGKGIKKDELKEFKNNFKKKG